MYCLTREIKVERFYKELRQHGTVNQPYLKTQNIGGKSTFQAPGVAYIYSPARKVHTVSFRQFP